MSIEKTSGINKTSSFANIAQGGSARGIAAALQAIKDNAAKAFVYSAALTALFSAPEEADAQTSGGGIGKIAAGSAKKERGEKLITQGKQQEAHGQNLITQGKQQEAQGQQEKAEAQTERTAGQQTVTAGTIKEKDADAKQTAGTIKEKDADKKAATGQQTVTAGTIKLNQDEQDRADNQNKIATGQQTVTAGTIKLKSTFFKYTDQYIDGKQGVILSKAIPIVQQHLSFSEINDIFIEVLRAKNIKYDTKDYDQSGSDENKFNFLLSVIEKSHEKTHQ